jgi:hypothetical protein
LRPTRKPTSARFALALLGAAAAAALALPAPASAAPPSTPLAELVRKADTVQRGKSSAGVFTMDVKTQSYARSFKIVMWDDSRGEERTLIKILGPALWRGYGTLKVGSQLKLYNPKSDHVTVVSNSMLGDNWMGSHFTNDDLVKETQLARHYRARLVKSWPGTDERGQAVTFHLIELRPKPTAPVAWGKILFEVWERGDTVMPTKAEYFRKAKGGTADRTLVFSQVRQMGGRLVPARMAMTLAKKPGEYTAITYSELRFDIAIPSAKFTEQALRH